MLRMSGARSWSPLRRLSAPPSGESASPAARGRCLTVKIDLRADLNREDDDGLGWALVLAPTDPGSSARTPCCEQALRSSGHGCASPAWMKTVRSTSARSPQRKPRHRVNSPKRDDPLSPGVSTESRPSSMPEGRLAAGWGQCPFGRAWSPGRTNPVCWL
jgi:hypothetical protein